MSNLPWSREDVDPRLDRELQSLFSATSEMLTPDRAAMDRVQMKVQAKLRREEQSAGGGLRRKLAFGSLGGGALWATALGTAAAHKLTAAVVIGGLIASGAVAAEQTGVGAGVRETLHLEQALHAITGGDDENDELLATATAEGTTEATATVESDELTHDGEPVSTVAPADGQPGNTRTSLLPTGAFTLRAELVGYDTNSVTLLVAGEGAAITIALADGAAVIVPTSADEGTDQLAPYLGRLVNVHGVCDEPAEGAASLADCSVSRVQVLGGPGGGPNPGGPPGSASESEGAITGEGATPTATPTPGSENGQGQGNDNAGGNGNGNAGGNGVGNGNAGGNGAGPPGDNPGENAGQNANGAASGNAGGIGVNGQGAEGGANGAANGSPPENSNAGGNSAENPNAGGNGQGNGNAGGNGNGNGQGNGSN